MMNDEQKCLLVAALPFQAFFIFLICQGEIIDWEASK